MRLIVSFVVCLLGAAGFDAVVQSIENKRARAWHFPFLLCLTFGIGCVILPGLLHEHRFKPFLPGIIALTASVMILGAARFDRVRWFAAAIALLAVIDMVSFGWRYNTTMETSYAFPANRVADRLSAGGDPYRATVLNFALLPDNQLMVGFSDVRGMDFPTEWYARYFDLIPERIDWSPYTRLISRAESPLLRVLNLKYVLTAGSNVVADSTGIDWIADLDGMYLGRLPSVQPRGFMVYESTLADDAQAEALLRENPQRVYDRVLLSERSDDRALTPEEIAEGNARVECLDYKPQSSSWAVRTGTPGYLFTSDAYYPGWRVTVDGEPATIHRANIAFRAVWIPEGDHRVEYRYRPAYMRWGLALAALGVVICFWTLRPYPLRPQPDAAS